MHLRKILCLLLPTFVSQPAAALNYSMLQGDTLWRLADVYLYNPLLWPSITNLDKSPIADVYRIPVGHMVYIPTQSDTEPAPSSATKTSSALQSQATTPRTFEVSQRHPAITIANPDHFVYLTKREGLVRAFYEGRHVTIPVSMLLEKIESQSSKVVPIGDGVAISKELVNEILGIKK